MIHPYKLLFLLVPFGIWSILFLAVRVGALHVKTLQRWRVFVELPIWVACLLLFVTDNPHADVAMFLFFSFSFPVEMTVWLGQRRKNAASTI
jgi:hypothetical protein